MTSAAYSASANFAEITSMTEPSRPTPMLGLTGPVGDAVNRFMPLIKGAVLVVSVLAAIPTAQNLYYSWSHGIPFNEVSHRLTQYELWMKNLECKIEYRALSTASGSKVDVGACQKTGDIAIKVSGANGQSTYEWIAFDQLKKATQAASLLDLLIPPAVAEEAVKPATSVQTPLPEGAFRIAQAGMEVMCQKKQGDKIVRVIKDGGKCYRETLSPLKGSVDKREEVACSTTC